MSFIWVLRPATVCGWDYRWWPSLASERPFGSGKEIQQKLFLGKVLEISPMDSKVVVLQGERNAKNEQEYKPSDRVI